MTSREVNFDGLVGPTHNYAGLSVGNLASMSHEGEVSNPRAAALQGLDKMSAVRQLGVTQAVLPPHYRPHLPTLRSLGFGGSNAEVLEKASENGGHALRSCSSASAMWTANAATVAPSRDAEDNKLHLSPANLSSMFHRSIEAATTTRILRKIFASEEHFTVHEPLPPGSHFSDEGAANHTRLATEQGAVHLFAWGRHGFSSERTTERYPARQTQEASAALARRHELPDSMVLLWQQAPQGIDRGSFHTDVLATGNGTFMMFHEHAFVNLSGLVDALRERLGHTFSFVIVGDEELSVQDAVSSYPFNSQILTLPDGSMVIVAPREAQKNAASRRFLQRVVDEHNPVEDVLFIDVNASMNNGGGPACLRLRVLLEESEINQCQGRVFLDEALERDLRTWIQKHYRDRLAARDLADPALLLEVETALDELSRILRLGSIYEFQT